MAPQSYVPVAITTAPHGSEASETYIFSIPTFVTFGLATVIVGLRIYARTRWVRAFGLDDALIVVAYLLSAGMTGIVGQEVHQAIYHPEQYDSPTLSQLVHRLQIQWKSAILYFFCTCIIKISVLLLYRRLTPDVRFRRIIYAVLAFIVLQYIPAILGTVFPCKPVSSNWNFTPPTGCINIPAFQQTEAALEILTDFILVLMPMPVILSLQMSKRRRAILLSVLVPGLIPCVASIGRIYGMHFYLTSGDVVKYVPILQLCSIVEMNVGIIATSLPPIYSLILHTFTVLKSRVYRSEGSSMPTSIHVPTVGGQQARTSPQVTPGESVLHSNDTTVVSQSEGGRELTEEEMTESKIAVVREHGMEEEEEQEKPTPPAVNEKEERRGRTETPKA
jgi:hypothetical protein